MYLFLKNATMVALVLLMLAPQASAQKVKLKNDKVEVKHLVLPKQPLPAEVRTYSRSVSASGDTKAALSTAVKTLEEALVIPGYNQVGLGDVHLELIPSTVTWEEIYTKKVEKSTKDKDGKVSTTISYTVYVPTFFDAKLRIIKAGGEIILEEDFGPVPGTPPSGSSIKSASSPKEVVDGVIKHPSTYTRFDIQIEGSWNTPTQARAAVRKAWPRHVATVRSRAIAIVSKHIEDELQTMGYRTGVSVFKLSQLKEGHPETDAFNKAHEALATALRGLGPDTGFEDARQKAEPAFAYFSQLAGSLAGNEDKQAVKLYEATLEHLLYGYTYLERFKEARGIISSLSEKEQKKYTKQIYPLENKLDEQLAELPVESRYTGTFAEANSALAPAEADPTELYGLMDEQIVVEARDQKIGLTEVEEEFAAMAYGGDKPPMSFNGIAAPRTTTDWGDGKSALMKLLNVDKPAILGENVRGFSSTGGDDVRNIDFARLPYDTFAIGDRTFVKLDIKQNMVQKSLNALPTWFEIIYDGPTLQIYQQAWTEYEVRKADMEMPSSAKYTIKLQGEKYQHTSSPQWALTPLKSLAKHLACPAVDQFLEEESPAAHYLSMRRIGEIYTDECK